MLQLQVALPLAGPMSQGGDAQVGWAELRRSGVLRWHWHAIDIQEEAELAEAVLRRHCSIREAKLN